MSAISDFQSQGAEVTLDTAREFVVLRWTRDVTTGTYYDVLDRVTELPGWTRRFGRLVIYERISNMSSLGHGDAEKVFNHVMAWHEKHHAGCPVRAASVVKRGSLEPMLRLWEQITNKTDLLDVNLFTTEPEAIAWLTEPDYLAREC